MRVGQAVGDVRDPLENPQHGDTLRAPHVLGKRVPLDVLHGDERLPIVLADVEHRNDVPVTQPRDRARFAGETRTQILVAGFLEQLDGDLAFEEGIPGEQKFTHAALANSVDDLKAPDSVRQFVHSRSGSALPGSVESGHYKPWGCLPSRLSSRLRRGQILFLARLASLEDAPRPGDQMKRRCPLTGRTFCNPRTALRQIPFAFRPTI